MDYNVENLTKRIQKSKNRKKTVTNIIYSVLIVFFIINIVFVIQNILNSNKVPNLFGYKTFSIVTRKYGTNNRN